MAWSRFILLRGARRAIERFHPLIVFEVCPSWLAKMQTSPAELFAELMNHGYRIHPLPQRAIAWERQVTLHEVAGMGPGAFINSVAVPLAKTRNTSTLTVPISTQ